MPYQPLTKKQVRSTIRGNGAANRTAALFHFWIHPEDFPEQHNKLARLFDEYPQDVQQIRVRTPKMFEGCLDDSEYRWMNIGNPFTNSKLGLDAKGALKDWSQLDSVLKSWPDPLYSGVFPQKPKPDGRYRLAFWWYCLFEMLWQFRGMTEALMDLSIEQQAVHRLFRNLTDFYLVLIERASDELQADGVFVSDDLGTQKAPFFSVEVFRNLFRPYFKELIDKAHSLDMDFWLHSCGNVQAFIPDLIELGLDVLHPIQKYTMNENEIADLYGADICIWAGFDVQQILPAGSPARIRREVRRLLDTFYRPEGRLILGAGNVVSNGTPLSNLRALFDETFRYSTEIATQSPFT